jgi:hypothetical protein
MIGAASAIRSTNRARPSAHCEPGLGAPEAEEAYARAQQLAVALNRPRDLLSALNGQWIYYVVQADLNRARQLAWVVRDFAETSGDIAALESGCHMRGCIHMTFGEFAETRADLEQSLALLI